MAWSIRLTRTAQKDLQKLDRKAARRILAFLEERVIASGNPRLNGKALTGVLGDRWSYRLGDYRILCDIQDEVVIVLVLTIGHRKDVYE
ncbi:type II toxin-antitoxin system RelE family toxin [Rhabdaerophilum sp.]|uniref:type II toxin-antitoxin system RelE family toxin n=1 Tax=Rhabdaerophilum sp. TaxID=2717341 RepID=UPI0038D481D2